MKKKTRKFISTGLVLCLLLLIVGNCYAVDNTDNTLTLTATDVSFFKAHGVDVYDDAILKFVDVTNSNTAKRTKRALSLTQTKNGITTTDIFLAYEKDESGIEPRYTMVDPADEGYSGELGRYSNYDIVIHYTVDWTFYYDSAGVYVRPQSLSWSYEKTDSSVSVTYGWVKYATTGALCTYPAFSLLQDRYTHNIIKNTNNPVEGSLYSAYNALPTARVIDLAGMSGGMAIVSNFTVDGRAIEDGTIVLGGF